MSNGTNVLDNKKGQNKTAAKNTNAAKVDNKANAGTPAAGEKPAEGEGDKSGKVAAPIAAPKPVVFKIAAKQPPKQNGKRGGKGGNAGAYLVGKLKFAECSYNHYDRMLKHVLNGNYRPAYAHTSGFFATADGIGSTAEQAVPAEVTARYDSLEAAIAAGDIYFSSVEGDKAISCVYNKNLEKFGYEERTSKPTVDYHCFLLCDKPEDVATAIKHLEAYEAMNPNNAGMVKFFTDKDGNVDVTPVVSKKQPAAAKVTVAGNVTENTDADAEPANAEAEAEVVEA